MVQNPDQAIATLQRERYQNVALPELMNQFKAEKVFTWESTDRAAAWRRALGV